VTNAGPSSGADSRTTTVSRECWYQSQFCASSVSPEALASGRTAIAVRLRRVDDLGADVQREHVSRVDTGALRDPVDLPEEPVVVLGDGRLETSGLGKHPGPVPARQAAEDLAICVDRASDAITGLLAVGASTLLRAPRDPDVRVRGRHAGHGISDRVGSHLYPVRGIAILA
jgi:hypothetical protein